MTVTAYSLWLLPPPAVRAAFASLIDALSRRLGTSRFEPHITLSDCPSASEAEVIARAMQLAQRLAPVSIRLTGVSYTDAYFRCLYLQAERSAELLAAHRLTCEHIGRPPQADFMPHLSLVYGHLDGVEKKKIIEEMADRSEVSFAADAIGLCLPLGSPDTWPLFGSFPLMGRGV